MNLDHVNSIKYSGFKLNIFSLFITKNPPKILIPWNRCLPDFVMTERRKNWRKGNVLQSLTLSCDNYLICSVVYCVVVLMQKQFQKV